MHRTFSSEGQSESAAHSEVVSGYLRLLVIKQLCLYSIAAMLLLASCFLVALVQKIDNKLPLWSRVRFSR